MRIIVLFNLKEGVARETYEEWARSRDIPGTRSLPSVDDFQVYRSTGIFGSESKPPFEYFEVIDINGIDAFVGDVGSDRVQKVAAEFQQFADNPLFVTTEAL
jgi:REDY-like protein HapK